MSHYHINRWRAESIEPEKIIRPTSPRSSQSARDRHVINWKTSEARLNPQQKDSKLWGDYDKWAKSLGGFAKVDEIHLRREYVEKLYNQYIREKLDLFLPGDLKDYTKLLDCVEQAHQKFMDLNTALFQPKESSDCLEENFSQKYEDAFSHFGKTITDVKTLANLIKTSIESLPEDAGNYIRSHQTIKDGLTFLHKEREQAKNTIVYSKNSEHRKEAVEKFKSDIESFLVDMKQEITSLEKTAQFIESESTSSESAFLSDLNNKYIIALKAWPQSIQDRIDRHEQQQGNYRDKTLIYPGLTEEFPETHGIIYEGFIPAIERINRKLKDILVSEINFAESLNSPPTSPSPDIPNAD
jgi:gas vesicle protein